MIKTLKAFGEYWRQYEGPISIVPALAGIAIDGDTIAYQIIKQEYPTFTNAYPKRLVEFIWQIDFFGTQVKKDGTDIVVTPFDKIGLMFAAWSSWLVKNPPEYLMSMSDEAAQYIPNLPGDKHQFVRLAKRYKQYKEVEYTLKSPNAIIDHIITEFKESE